MKRLLGLFLTVLLIGGAMCRFCAPGDTSVGCDQCPEGEPWTDCDIDPCVREAEYGCPLHRHENPVCVSFPCGGCYDHWFVTAGDGSRRQVWCWGP